MDDLEDGVSFDENHNVRIFNKDRLLQSEEFVNQTDEFVSKLTQFEGQLSEVLQSIKSHVVHVEREKLRAIGVRNEVEAEIELRDRRVRECQRTLAEKKEFLERLTDEFNSLVKVDQQQKRLIEKLGNSELGDDDDDAE